MSLLYFRAGFPFGYAIFGLGLAVIVLGGVVVAGWSMLRRPRAPLRALAAAAAAGFAVLVAVVNVRAEGAMDWNPWPVSADSMVGRWVGQDAVLELRPDSTFQCSRLAPSQEPCAAATTGWWQRADGRTVQLRPTRPDSIFRFSVVRYDGVLQLIMDPGDPDLRDGRFLFHREPAAAR